MKKKIRVVLGAKPRETFFNTLSYSGGEEYVNLTHRSLKEVVEEFQEIPNLYPEYENVWLEELEDGGSVSYQLTGIREETDFEYEWRLKKGAKEKVKKEEQERKQYEELKKKFKGS